jgi:uncharacterized protein (TIGR00251 family)
LALPGITIKVKVQPKSSGDRVVGFRDDVLRVRVTAAPERGKANQALVDLLSATLKVPKSTVRIIKGHTSRDKWVAVDDLSLDDLHRRLRENQTVDSGEVR